MPSKPILKRIFLAAIASLFPALFLTVLAGKVWGHSALPENATPAQPSPETNNNGEWQPPRNELTWRVVAGEVLCLNGPSFAAIATQEQSSRNIEGESATVLPRNFYFDVDFERQGSSVNSVFLDGEGLSWIFAVELGCWVPANSLLVEPEY